MQPGAGLASIKDKLGAALQGNTSNKMENTANKPGGAAFSSGSYLQNQIGISISSGNYINTQNESQDSMPTWKKLAQAQ